MPVEGWLPSSTERVALNTAEDVKRRIHAETRARIEQYRHADAAAIHARLNELNQEWDIERTLQANMSLVLLTSLALGFTTSRKWFGFAGLVAGFFVQHAVQGWCPPVVPWRRAGVRTMAEIEEERDALRALRGDFHTPDSPLDAMAQAGI